MSVWRDDPASVRPMLASLEEAPLKQDGLVYEPKYDGIRALVDVRPPEGRSKAAAPHIAIYSRNGNEKHRQFPEIVAGLARVARTLDGPVLLDGEIVAIDAKGRPLGFQHIQGRIHLTGDGEIADAAKKHPAVLVVFDLLRDDREDLRGQPLAARRVRLHDRVRITPALARTVRLSEIVTDDGREMLARARREGWEGLIVKDGRSLYHSGRRTPAWRKLKLLNQQEFVVGGWTDPRLSRTHFGALLLGYHDKTGLRWAGSVGTGFDQAELARVGALLETRATPQNPFVDVVKTPEPAHWVRPDLVVDVRFTEWTSDGLLRHPVYLGMRTDKPAKDVRREQMEGAPAATPPPSHVHFGRRRIAHAPATAKATARQASLDALIERLHEMEHTRKDGDIDLPNGDTLHVTNLAKVFWPDLKITKGDLLRYYAEVSPLILPAVDDRPLVMKRFPNGVVKSAFYQQKHPEEVPKGVRREVLPEDVDPPDADGPRDRLIGGSLTTLLYMTQLAAISQDPWFSRVTDPLHPDVVAIDLDPGDGVGFERVLDVARWVKDELDRLGIPSVPKTSGASGMHIYLPLPPETTYDTGQLLCQMVATMVATQHPKVATVERMVKRRARGTVYVDYLQNILGKTLATAYSARASDYAGVSTPLLWDEVARPVDPRAFTIRTAPARFREVGDLWARLRTGKPVNLAAVLKRSAHPRK